MPKKPRSRFTSKKVRAFLSEFARLNIDMEAIAGRMDDAEAEELWSRGEKSLELAIKGYAGFVKEIENAMFRYESGEPYGPDENGDDD